MAEDTVTREHMFPTALSEQKLSHTGFFFFNKVHVTVSSVRQKGKCCW